MELNKLYSLAEKENIKIYSYYIDNCNGCFLKYKNNNSIALNYKIIDSSSKEKSVLAEELGHYYCDAIYSPLCTNNELISKQEYKAKKWAFKTIIKPNEIKELYKQGKRSKNEFAEELGVTEDLFEMAFQYYKDNGLLEVI